MIDMPENMTDELGSEKIADLKNRVSACAGVGIASHASSYSADAAASAVSGIADASGSWIGTARRIQHALEYSSKTLGIVLVRDLNATEAPENLYRVGVAAKILRVFRAKARGRTFLSTA